MSNVRIASGETTAEMLRRLRDPKRVNRLVTHMSRSAHSAEEGIAVIEGMLAQFTAGLGSG